MLAWEEQAHAPLSSWPHALFGGSSFLRSEAAAFTIFTIFRCSFWKITEVFTPLPFGLKNMKVLGRVVGIGESQAMPSATTKETTCRVGLEKRLAAYIKGRVQVVDPSLSRIQEYTGLAD